MEYPHLRVPYLKIPQQSELVTNAIKEELLRLKLIAKEGMIVKVECVTAFGIATVGWIQAGERDLLRMAVVDAKGKEGLIVTTASQCSFRFSFSSSKDDKEIVVRGYGETDQPQPETSKAGKTA